MGGQRAWARWASATAAAAVLLAAPDLATAAKAKKADLTVKSPKVSVSSALPSRPVAISATVKNSGKAAAKASSVRGYLATKAKRGKTDLQLLGKVSTKPLKAGKAIAVQGTVMVPATAPTGTYRLLLCADDAKKVKESSETNNCAAVAGAFTVTTPQTTPGIVPGGTLPVPGGSTPSPGPAPGPGPDPGPGPGPTDPGPTDPGPTDPGPTTPVTPAPDLPGGNDPIPDSPAPPTARTLSPTTQTTVAEASSFLYEGAGAVQTGVDPDDIDPARAGVLRGKVLQTDGTPLPGVTVTVDGHPELGQTVTRTDGHYDLAVNGGTNLTLHFERPTFLPADRLVPAPARDYDVIDELVMKRFDSKKTPVEAGAPTAQVAVSSTTSDSDGSRRANLIFLPDTHATMTLANGTKQPLPNTMTVRATEYTVGERGPESMPSSLPPASGYTHAIDYTVDEAVAAGASRVDFDKPVVTYTDNFLGFPVGMAVPAGSYDGETNQWVPEANGRVVKLVAVSGGVAQLDVNGDGNADTGQVLVDLGITTAELQQLAGLYEAGKTLWRVQVTHFTPWDHNWPFGPPPDGTSPNPPKPPKKPKKPKNPKDPKDPCKKPSGSWVECDSRALREQLAVAGTPYTLNYNSDRAEARRPLTVEIPLSGATIPASLKRIDLDIKLAGRTWSSSRAAAPNATETFTWDGNDAYGRKLYRKTPGTADIWFVYDGVYQSPAANTAAFNRLGGARIDGVPTRSEIRIKRTVEFDLGEDAKPPSDLGGWSLSVNHALDTVGGAVTLGSGDRQITPVKSVTRMLADQADEVVYGEAGRQIDQPVWQPDGSVWFPDVLITYGSAPTLRIRRVAPDGTISTIATFPSAPNASSSYPIVQMTAAPDGGVYVLPRLSQADYIEVSPGHSDYVERGQVVWHVSPAGAIKQITAGSANSATAPTDAYGPNNTLGTAGDGKLAKDVALDNPRTLATGPDGSLYIGESDDYPTTHHRIQQITPDGVLRTVWSGNGIVSPQGGGQWIMWSIYGMAVGPDGSMYLQTLGYNASFQIWRITPSGVMQRVAGAEFGDGCCSGGENPLTLKYGTYGALAVLPTGEVVFASDRSLNLVTATGRIEVLAGNPTDSGADRRKSASAIPADFTGVRGIAVSGDGRVVASTTRSGLRTAEPGIAGYSFSGYPVPIGRGDSTAVFNAAGRHTKTVDSLTGGTELDFAYDSGGRLTKITDRDGRVTTIERTADGKPTAIVASGGERTTLAVDASDNLTSVKRDGQPATTLTYAAGGLLTKEVDAGGGTHTFTYDSDGFLTTDQDPDGITTTVAGADEPDGSYKSTLTLPSGRKTTYVNGGSETAGWTRTVTDAAGAVSQAKVGIDGKLTSTGPDGSVTTVSRSSDPRFGGLDTYEGGVSIKQPSGLELTTAAARETQLNAPGELFNPKTLTQTARLDGSIINTLSYDRVGKTVRNDYSGGARTIKTLDSKQRTSKLSRFAGAADIDFTYDARGRLTKVTQGGESTTYAYDARDRLASRQDALGRTTSYTTDATGRTSSVTVPGGQAYGFGYDALDRMTQVTMPGGATHQMTYTPAGRPKSYAPPGSGAGYVKTRDADGKTAKTVTPGNQQITNTRDAGGRLISMAYPEATASMTYVGADDRGASLTRTPAGGGTAAGLAWTYDGSLVKSVEASGPSAGKYAYTYNGSFRLTSSVLTVGGTTITDNSSYYGNGTLASRGGYSFTRNGPLNGVTSVSGHGLSATVGWDTLGRQNSRSDSVGGTSAYAMNLTRDNAGRITQKVETIPGGGTHTFNYAYDLNGRLTQVERDSVVTESYTYDAAGNRLSRTAGGTTKTATYETAKTALDTFGGVDYTVNSDGFTTKRGTDTFTWSARGELLSAAVSGGTTTYAYDGFGRRVAMTVGGQTTKYLYGDPQRQLQATAVIEPDGTLTTFDINDAGVIFGYTRGGTHYNVAADQVGSPMVVTTDAGAVMKTVTYSAYGEVLTDSAPGFKLPIGYAGALPDASTGLLRMGIRDYDPATGRFTSRDPLGLDGGDPNLYAYVAGDPIQNSDPSGLVSAGGTMCEGGFCAGVKWGWNDDGFSLCGEIGLGAGNDVSFNPLGGPDDDKIYVKGGVELSVGPLLSYELGESATTDFTECRKLEITHTLCVVGACIDTSDGIKLNPEKIGDLLGKAPKVGADVKVMSGACKKLW